MKKSEIYKTMQRLVLNDQELYEDVALEILRELFAQEDMAKLMEDMGENGKAVEE